MFLIKKTLNIKKYIRFYFFSNMKIAKSSIKKNYYFVPKIFVKNFAFLGCVAVLYYTGKKWKIYEKYINKLEEMVSFEEMKKASLNFVGEMLFDNLARINLSKYLNDNVNKSDDSIQQKKELEEINKIEFVRNLLKKYLDDDDKYHAIKTRFIKNILQSLSNQNKNEAIDLFLNKDNLDHELNNLIIELFTSYDVVLRFCTVLEQISKKTLNTKELNKSIDTFTDDILSDENIKESIYIKIEKYFYSTPKIENNHKDSKNLDEMKKVNNQLMDLINKL